MLLKCANIAIILSLRTSLTQTLPVFRSLVLTTAHPTLTMTREGTPQNFALWLVGRKKFAAKKKMWIVYVNL
jgi:hypothetical protein